VKSPFDAGPMRHAGGTQAWAGQLRASSTHLLLRLPEIADVLYLDVLATPDSKSGILTLLVASRDWNNFIPPTTRLRDFSRQAEASVEPISGDSVLAGDDDEHPVALRPVKSSLAVSGSEIRYSFPEDSVTVITLKSAH